MKTGAWHIGRRWKVWAIIGSWFYFEAGTRRIYLGIGRWHIESEVQRRG